jgi:hypothetical protein
MLSKVACATTICAIALALLTGCAAVGTPPAARDSSPATTSERVPPPPARTPWIPGTPHPTAPNVVAAAIEGDWAPVAGYAFTDRATLTVVWVPGQKHPTATNVVASVEQGKWTPDEGYEWINPADQSLDVRWLPSKAHSQFPHVVAAEQTGSWRPEAGYSWARPELRELQHVRWAPGTSHPSAPNVVAGLQDGEWNAADGYEWMNPRALSLEVRRKAALSETTTSQGVDWTGAMIKTFEGLGSDIVGIERQARSYTSASRWRLASNADVAAAGAGACAIPVVGVAALPAEFVYLMRQMYNSTLGMGFVIAGTAAPSDFPNILAVWSDELTLDDQTLRSAYEVAEKVAAEASEQLAESAVDQAVENAMKRLSAKSNTGQPLTPTTAPPGVRAQSPVVSNALAQKSGAKASGKLGAKVAAKSGAKIGAKYAAKVGVSWIPFVSAAACAGANAWIMDSILDAAEMYFRRTSEYRAKRYSGAKLH